ESIYVTVDSGGSKVKASHYDTLRSEVKLEVSSTPGYFNLAFHDKLNQEFNRYLTYWRMKPSWLKVKEGADERTMFKLVEVEVDKNSQASQQYNKLKKELKKYTTPKKFFRVQNSSLNLSNYPASFLAVDVATMTLHHTETSRGESLEAAHLTKMDDIKYGADLWYLAPAPGHPGDYALKNVATDLHVAIDAKGYLYLDHKWTPASYIALGDGFDPDQGLSNSTIKFKGTEDAQKAYHLTYSSKNYRQLTTRAKAGTWAHYNILPAKDFDHVRQRYTELLYERQLPSSLVERYHAYANVTDKLMDLAKSYQHATRQLKKANVSGAAIGSAGAITSTVAAILVVASGPAAPVVAGVGVTVSLAGSVIGGVTKIRQGTVDSCRHGEVQQALTQINLHDQRFKDHFNLLLSKDLRYPHDLTGFKNFALDMYKLFTTARKLLQAIPGVINTYQAWVQDAQANASPNVIGATAKGAEEVAVETVAGAAAEATAETAAGAATETAAGTVVQTAAVEGLAERIAESASEGLKGLGVSDVASESVGDAVQSVLGKVGETSLQVAGDIAGAGLSTVFMGVRIYALVKASADLMDKDPDAATAVIYNILTCLRMTLAQMEEALLVCDIQDSCAPEASEMFAKTQAMVHSDKWTKELEAISAHLSKQERDRTAD
ncbi:MAG: hypothetical protein OXT67_10280, partial [Zetaproteobacteria bacterium]|nr:hypothetical protein [Zetaproteobacteria bacterium]